MRYTLYAGTTYLMSSNDRDKLVNATASQLRRWLEEMGAMSYVGEVEIALFDNGVKQATRRFLPAQGRLCGWTPKIF